MLRNNGRISRDETFDEGAMLRDVALERVENRAK